MDKGLDGLRVDSVNFIYEDERFLDEPLSHKPGKTPEMEGFLKHIYTRDQPESVAVVQDWRKIFDSYSARGGTTR